MYTTPFYIRRPVGNNIFSFSTRKNKQIYVPSLIQIDSLDEIELGKEIVFEEKNNKGYIEGFTGLKNFYELGNLGKIGVKAYIFDNHNHAYFFWHLAKQKGFLEDKATLFHIDEHADMRKPATFISSDELNNMQKIFEYTNFTLNVGDYIIPAEKDGLIGETFQIRSETALLDILHQEIPTNNNILNIDLDFFHPDLDFIPFLLKKEVILKLAEKSQLITIATSPYFIDQEKALLVLKKLFTNS